MRFNEDTLDAKIKRELGPEDEAEAEKAVAGMSDAEVAAYEGDIEKALTKAYNTNLRQLRRGTNEFQSVLLVGEAGTGKSSRVVNWAKQHGVNLFTRDVKTMDMSDLGGIYHPNKEGTKAVNLPNASFDPLDRPNSVLFLDEYNRANSQLRGVLLELVNGHYIPDTSEPDGRHHFNNLVLVVAAINPQDESSGSAYSTDELDAAELSRFRQVNVKSDKLITLKYLQDLYAKEFEGDTPEDKLEDLRKASLASVILKDRMFTFDDPEEVVKAQSQQRPILNPRSFARLLDASDGTKEDFLDLWDDYCNKDKKTVIKKILQNYEDPKPAGAEAEPDEMAELEKEFGGENSPIKSGGSDFFKGLQAAMSKDGLNIG